MLLDALVCTEPGSLRMEARGIPKPGPGEALVKPRRIGVCGTDFHIFEGKHPFLEYPRVMGHELAVEVVDAPPGAGLAPGEICVVNPYISCGRCIACDAGKPNCCVNIAVLGVHRDGGMTGLLTLPARNLIRATGLTLDQCATVEFLAIGAHAVRRGNVGPRDTALVVGAGAIGLGVAVFARAVGASVTVLDSDAARMTQAREIARVATLPHGEDPLEAVRALTNGDGFDVVFDATGNQAAMEKGFAYVAHGGRYVLVGVMRNTITFSDPDFHRKEMTLLASRNALGQDFERVTAGIRAGEIPVDRLITHRTTLAGAVGDLPRWAKEKTGLIKALIEAD